MEVSKQTLFSSTNLPRETYFGPHFLFVHPYFLSLRLSPTPLRTRGKDARKKNKDGRIEGNHICVLEYS